MTDPRVSVIIDGYNYGEFIGPAIASVIDQNAAPGSYEVIVVDDGSTDNTRDVVRDYPEVNYIYQENGGQARAFMAGIARSRGSILCFLDADDRWHPDKLRAVVDAFDTHPDAGMVQHLMQEVDAAGRELPTWYETRKERAGLQDFLRGEITFTGTSGLAFRRSLLERILPVPDELFYCADEYLYNIIFFSPVISLPRVLGYKTTHGRNWFAGTISDPARLERHVRVRKAILRELERFCRRSGHELKRTGIYLPLELLKEEVLLAAINGRRGYALSAISGYLKGRRLNRKILKACVTLAIALVSPRLYHRLYSWYASRTLSGRNGGAK